MPCPHQALIVANDIISQGRQKQMKVLKLPFALDDEMDIIGGIVVTYIHLIGTTPKEVRPS